MSDGDLVFFRRITYTPEHGDIVLVNCESRREVLVKRVIGLPGDVIEIDEKTASVYRNGKLLEEDYISTPTSSRANMTGPVTVREDCIFVMGDNRENSGDSRYDDIGQILDILDICLTNYSKARIYKPGDRISRIYPTQIYFKGVYFYVRKEKERRARKSGSCLRSA